MNIPLTIIERKECKNVYYVCTIVQLILWSLKLTPYYFSDLQITGKLLRLLLYKPKVGLYIMLNGDLCKTNNIKTELWLKF